METPVQDEDVQQAQAFRDSCTRLLDELRHVIVGQDDVIEQVLIAMFSRGHCLLEGVPGLAKTLLVRTLARVLSLRFHRIQFTPDLMPADIIGTEILREDRATGHREFEFVHGPLFANIVLADEINRTPPKTQAAMLEAMQERMISSGGRDYKLPNPFFVLATQNPLEQEGTYPLPEAQLDRFLLYVRVDYPSGAQEWEIARRVTSGPLPTLEPVMSADEIIAAQNMVMRMPACDHVVGYSWALVRASRPGTPEAPDFVNKWVNWGAGPRGVLTLVVCAKARALLHGRYHASVEDVQAVIAPALRHRVRPNYAALAANVNADNLIQLLLEAIPADAVYEPPKA